MKITKEQPPAPPPKYVLGMSYPELHKLHRELSDLTADRDVRTFHRTFELLAEIKEHV